MAVTGRKQQPSAVLFHAARHENLPSTHVNMAQGNERFWRNREIPVKKLDNRAGRVSFAGAAALNELRPAVTQMNSAVGFVGG